MKHVNPYKRNALGLLLGFAYPEDGRVYFETGQILMPSVADPDTIVAYPNREPLQEAVADVLRAHIGQRAGIRNESLDEIERASNEPVAVVRTLSGGLRLGGGLRLSLRKEKPVGRIVTELLDNYLIGTGPTYGLICEQCQKVFLLIKSDQRFCSDRCRYTFWNDAKAKEYHKRKTRESRAHKKRLKRKTR